MKMKKLMKQAQEMQAQIDAQMQELRIESSSGGGAVTVTVDGGKKVHAVKIRPDVVDPEDVEMLEDLVLAALNEAFTKVDEQLQDRLGGLAGGLMGF